MSFQTRDLWMVSLGVVGDVPFSPLQEPLPDGMHLRWAFHAAKGFPWYGYHLFRRPSRRDSEKLCLSRYLRGYRAGAVLGTSVTLGPGTLTSDQPLRLTDDFPGTAVPEIDLDGRTHVSYDLPAGDPAYRVQATIGFRRGDQGERVCVDYGRERPGPVDNPLEREQARFTSHDHRGVPFPEGRVTRVGGFTGWDVGLPRTWREAPAYADLREWPTDQEQLRHKLAEHGNETVPGKDTVTQTWNGVLNILGSPVPPKQQAAIFKIAATLPGIETEELKDATGRSGIAVTRVDNRGPGGAVSRESLIFDKTSYVLLGGQERVPGQGRELWSITRPRITDVLPAWSKSLKRRGCL